LLFVGERCEQDTHRRAQAILGLRRSEVRRALLRLQELAHFRDDGREYRGVRLQRRQSFRSETVFVPHQCRERLSESLIWRTAFQLIELARKKAPSVLERFPLELANERGLS